MSITKKFLKDKNICKVGFKLEGEAALKANSAHIVADFNNWDTHSGPMKKLKDGSFSATLDLETGKEYQFLYLIDGAIWQKEESADKYVPSPYVGSENSVIVL
jgi:1,4-alpha-glucan branching enzyme